MQNIVDGVHRKARNDIEVIIVGAGPAGLQAALECWRNGCDVKVIEKAEKLSSIGDFFTITPSALTTLKEYPNMLAEYHRNVYDCTIHVYTPAGKPVYNARPEWKSSGAVHAAPDVDISFLKRRPEFAQMQLEQCERLSIPIFWNEEVTQVTEYDDNVKVTTRAGKEFTGDVCIGANGIGSSIPGFSTGAENAVQSSGYAIARVAFPRSNIRPGSLANTILHNVEEQPSFRTYLGVDFHLILFLTKDWVAICFTHRDENAEESWTKYKNSTELFQMIEQSADDWDPAVLDFVRQAPPEFVDWKLRWRDCPPQWTSDKGRLIRIGDCAHAFLPSAGNGAVQALEDALSLAECLTIGGKANVPKATKVHNKLRFERVSILQLSGFSNREELHKADKSTLEKGDNSKLGFFRLGRWVWSHDPVKYAKDSYAACLEHLEQGTQFTNCNIPPGHVYKPWSLESENRRMKAGIASNLKDNGDWSA